ncbi:MAG: response regulator transcription factor [Bryobacterales bacterium]|nr:response regulator transcription factor [Bryobacterales bacterium]
MSTNQAVIAAPHRVVFADDHAGLHPLVRRILEPQFQVVDSVFDGQALVNSAAHHSPDVLVVDIAMPHLNGLEAVRQLRPLSNAVVVFLTTHADRALLEQALEAGAHGYVLKAAAASDLIPAIRAALRGERFVSAAVISAS